MFKLRYKALTNDGRNVSTYVHGCSLQQDQWNAFHAWRSLHSSVIDRTDRASVAPATVRPTSNSRSHERTSVSHANGIHHQQQPSNPPGTLPPIIPLVRSSNSPRDLATSQSDQSGGLFNFPPPGPSSQKPHETENSSVNRIHLRERNHLPHPVVSFDWDSVWGLFRHAHGGSSTNRSASFWGRHRS